MLSQMKWTRFAMKVMIVFALLSSSVWAKKPVPPPEPEPDPPVTYGLTWLDAFPESYVYAMNSHGHVVGFAASPDRYGGVTFAFLYTPENGMLDLNTLVPEDSGWLLRRGWGINDQGQIVGYGELEGDPTIRAYRYTPAVLNEEGAVLLPARVEQIGPLTPDDPKWTATAINEVGEICGVGNHDYIADTRVAWYYNDVTGIEPLLGGLNLSAETMNNAGQILGPVEDSNDTLLFRVVPGETPDFFQSPAGEDYTIWGNDMNDNGWFVGKTALGVTQKGKRVSVHWGAYRHDGSNFVDLEVGERSEAHGINNQGDVVGTVGDGTGFVYLEDLGTLVNLDQAVSGDPDDLAIWFDASIAPQRINDAGQIAGNSSFAFLLTPVPGGK